MFIKDGIFVYCEGTLNIITYLNNTIYNYIPSITLKLDNAAVIVNPKGEMKGSAITGPGKILKSIT